MKSRLAVVAFIVQFFLSASVYAIEGKTDCFYLEPEGSSNRTAVKFVIDVSSKARAYQFHLIVNRADGVNHSYYRYGRRPKDTTIEPATMEIKSSRSSFRRNAAKLEILGPPEPLQEPYQIDNLKYNEYAVKFRMTSRKFQVIEGVFHCSTTTLVEKGK